MTKIKPGTLAIFTMSDEPSARMVAVVTKVTRTKIYGRYLCDRPVKSCDPWVSGDGMFDRCTPIQDFGVDAEIDMDLDIITCRKNRPSIAQYLDGQHRRWQGADCDIGHFHSAKRKHWARWAVNKQIATQNIAEMGERIRKRVADRMATKKSEAA